MDLYDENLRSMDANPDILLGFMRFAKSFILLWVSYTFALRCSFIPLLVPSLEPNVLNASHETLAVSVARVASRQMDVD